jgi:hypothetical protein
MITRVTLLLSICLAASVGIIAQNKSSYTSVRSCHEIGTKSDKDLLYEGECPGIGGYKLRLLEGDLRQSLTLVTPVKKKQELNFWSLYGGFSWVGEKVEWRLKKGVPVALIARLTAVNPEDNKSTSYLVVVKITKSSSCVTDMVAPMAKQNEKARELADAAASKPCRSVE